MRISMTDVAIYVYTLGGIITGIFIQRMFSSETRLAIIAIGALVAVFWTAYFTKVIAPRYSPTPPDDEIETMPRGSDETE